MGAADTRYRRAGPPAPVRTGRDPAFDGLRVIALLAGVLFHATLSYADVPLAVTPWPRLSADPSRLASVLLWWTRTFHLPLFFFLAGFAAAHSLRRRGRKAFLVERIRRLLVPFFVLGVVLLPVTYYVFAFGWWLTDSCTWNEIRRAQFQPELQAQIYGPAHLWFLQDLFLCCLLLSAVAGRAHRTRAVAATRLLWWTAASIGVLVLDASFVTGHPNTFLPPASRLFYYGCFFAAGADRAGTSAERPPTPRAAIGWLLASLVCFLIAEPLVRRARSVGLSPVLHAAFAASWALCAWSSVLGFSSAAVCWLGRPQMWTRRLAAASYWIYLVHVPLVVALQIGLAVVPLPALVKVAAVAIVATVLCLWSYEWERGRIIIAGALRGRRPAPHVAVPNGLPGSAAGG